LKPVQGGAKIPASGNCLFAGGDLGGLLKEGGVFGSG